MYNSVFNNKVVLVTGHTGFKGSWLTAWLIKLGAKVVGFSRDIPTNPSNYQALFLEDRIDSIFGDVCNIDQLKNLLEVYKPNYIFHLAAQPLVRKSYEDPYETYQSNVVGTLNILECLRFVDFDCNCVFITSDKCYDNVEQIYGYKENDKLGGKDPYSASKGCAELIIRSYVESFFKRKKLNIKIGIGRAGNVIGGGDWALDRIVPDAMRAWSNSLVLEIRHPNATRPWQHVLEPLSGYLALAESLSTTEEINGEPFNFGPSSDQNFTVSKLLNELKKYWENSSWNDISESKFNYEAGLLKLCCDKALHVLNWKPVLFFEENVKMTSEWYSNYLGYKNDNWDFTISQIEYYEKLALKRGIQWAQ